MVYKFYKRVCTCADGDVEEVPAAVISRQVSGHNARRTASRGEGGQEIVDSDV